MLGEFNGYGVITAILVVVITIVAGGVYTLCKKRKKGRQENQFLILELKKNFLFNI